MLLLGGCAVSTTDTIATLPALKTGKAEETTRSVSNLPTTVAVLPFKNRTTSEFAFQVVRRTMFNHFSSKNYRMLHWQDVDRRLALAGLETPAEIEAKTAEELMAILGVDGLLYGDITHYDKKFAAVYAQVAVGVELKFVGAKNNTIWEVKDVQRSHAGGISTTPVGLLLNALIAAKHIYGDINLYRAADELGRDLAKQMPEPENLSQNRKPVISDVVHSGVGQYLKYGDELEVVLMGDPGLTAVASVEGMGLIDLAETTPGIYQGSIKIDKSVNTEEVSVVGRLQDPLSQTSSWVSPYGLVTIDNTAPARVSATSTTSFNNAIQLNWASPEDTDIDKYQIALSTTETGAISKTYDTENSMYRLQDVNNFESVYISIAAIDHAGNMGASQRFEAIAAPDPRYGDAITLVGTLPNVISGINKLTPAGNPHQINNAIRIDTSGVLLVAPGVKFQVSPKAKISVLGELHIMGSTKAPVTVVDKANQGFDNFLTLQTNKPVTVSHLNVNGAGIAIDVTAGSPLITDSIFANNRFNGMTISGSSRPTIRNCMISDAQAAGVIVSGQAQPLFENNKFSNNQPFHLQNGSTLQINAKGNSWEPAASNITILGDVVF
ncbi:MAG: parallel beta-helix repeat protein [Candidatus Azotimanducaceae bacterium]